MEWNLFMDFYNYSKLEFIGCNENITVVNIFGVMKNRAKKILKISDDN